MLVTGSSIVTKVVDFVVFIFILFLVLFCVRACSSMEGTRARRVIGIASLRKPCLQYELRVRGQKEEGSVAELAQRLRAALTMPVNISPQIVGEVSDNLLFCRNLLADLQDDVLGFEAASPTRRQICRIRALLDHLVNRMRDVCAVSNDPSVLTEVQKLQDEILMLQQQILCLNWPDDETSAASGVSAEIPVLGGLSAFGKLPNPLMAILNKLSQLSVEGTDKLLELLWLLVKLHEQANVLRVSHSVVLQLVHPLAVGRLARIVAEALENQESLWDFRKTLLDKCLGTRERKDIIDKYVYRVQGEGETLSHYVSEVRLGILALCIEISEADAVANILDGMRPADRSRVLFGKEPLTFADLDELVTRIENVRYCDSKRREVDGDGIECRVKNVEVQQRRALSVVKGTCYRCNKPGHFVKDCPIPKVKHENS